MAGVVQKASALRQHLEGAARAAGRIGPEPGQGGAPSAEVLAELQRLSRMLSHDGRLELRRQNL